MAFTAGLAIGGAEAVHEDLCSRKGRYALIKITLPPARAGIKPYFLNLCLRGF